MRDRFVTCGTCSKWAPSRINPEQSMGLCAYGLTHWCNQKGPYGRAAPPYPAAERICDKYEKRKPS